MKIFPALFAVFALLLSTGESRADEMADKNELIRIEHACAAALVARDPKTLVELFSADWRLITSDASVMTRAELIKALDSGLLKFESCKLSDFDVRLYGDAAVVIGRGKSKLEWKGESLTGRDHFTDVFIRRDGKWQCVSSHSSDFPDDEAK